MDYFKDNFNGFNSTQLTKTSIIALDSEGKYFGRGWFCRVWNFKTHTMGHAFGKNKFTTYKNAVKDYDKQIKEKLIKL